MSKGIEWPPVEDSQAGTKRGYALQSVLEIARSSGLGGANVVTVLDGLEHYVKKVEALLEVGEAE